MKRFFSILLVIVLVICLCGCEKENNENSDVKIGLICLHDSNSPYDLNFINAFEAACKAKGVEYLIKTNIPESSTAYEAAAELADNGCNIVFADSFGHEGYMIQAAEEFPEVDFCHATGTRAHTQNLKNYHNAFASIYEGRYLDGVAAGLKLKEMIENGDITEKDAIVGYVGAYTYAEVFSGYTSFYLGVKSMCPCAKMKVTFTGSWYDETAEAESANILIEKYNCVIISGHADSNGIPNTCQSKGVPFVFYNGSVKEISPDTYIISTKINWQPYFEYIIDCKRNGEAIAVDWTGTLKNGSVEMSELNTSVAANGTERILKSVAQELIEGTIKVFDTNTFTVKGKTLNSYLADVDYDDAYEPDHEAIWDGYFHESELRSAPYFDIQIDGIELLNSAF